MLGDHLYASDSDVPCAQQLMQVYERTRDSVVGLKVTSADEIHLYGCVAGIWKDEQSFLISPCILFSTHLKIQL